MKKMNQKTLWKKMTALLLKVGEQLALLALTLWFCMRDPETPLRIKAWIFGDLVYLVSPFDAVPDPLPVIGYSDDLALLAATAVAVAYHIKPEHREKAKQMWEGWAGEQA